MGQLPTIEVTKEIHMKLKLFAMKHNKKVWEVTHVFLSKFLNNFKPDEELKTRMRRKLRRREIKLKKMIDKTFK